jgi:hypothetical protein
MKYRIRTKTIWIWPIAILSNIALLINFLILNPERAKNPFSAPTFWICFYGDILMMVQYFKLMLFEKHRHDSKFIESHQRDILDPTWLLMNPK